MFSCSECGLEFDRDTNSAINISRRGLSRPSGGDNADGFRDVVIYRNGDLGNTKSVTRGDV